MVYLHVWVWVFTTNPSKGHAASVQIYRGQGTKHLVDCAISSCIEEMWQCDILWYILHHTHSVHHCFKPLQPITMSFQWKVWIGTMLAGHFELHNWPIFSPILFSHPLQAYMLHKPPQVSGVLFVWFKHTISNKYTGLIKFRGEILNLKWTAQNGYLIAMWTCHITTPVPYVPLLIQLAMRGRHSYDT